MLRWPYLMIPPLDQAKFWICCSYYTYLRTDRRDWKGHTPLDRNHHRKVPEKQKGKGTCRAVWSPADFYLFHRWIKLSFGYVVLITLIYELTGGIERDTLHWTEIIIGKFLKNKKEKAPAGQFGRRPISISYTVGSCLFLDMWWN